ncbi:MAG: 2-C-methyl-D-erythritol 4-phosphate cytidylyltransferase, partial [Deltaproteobacteria bacterium]|nr:2-C-methyl-D-erythritol 4-phosphate cytidylyltransferase [Deltaproteobacteria bacterium]
MADDFFTSAVILGGGKGERFSAGPGDLPKQFLALGSQTVLGASIGAFAALPKINEIVVVIPADYGDYAAQNLAHFHKNLKFVEGGQKRSDSARLGFLATSPKAQVILIHDGARPLVNPLDIERVRLSAHKYGAAVLGLPLRDTLKVANQDLSIEKTLDRKTLWQAQTPQGFRRHLLEKAYALAEQGAFTDDSSMVEALGHRVKLVEGSPENFKITTASDLAMAQKMLNSDRPNYPNFRVGQGWDFHRFTPDRPLMLGCLLIPGEMGLEGHSDADVLAHAFVDAILGAGSLGDIGQLFPPDQPTWKG